MSDAQTLSIEPIEKHCNSRSVLDLVHFAIGSMVYIREVKRELTMTSLFVLDGIQLKMS